MTLTPDDKQKLIKNYVEKSLESMEDAKLLLINNRNNSSVNRIYYCIFYIISALALKYDFSSSKHTQLLGWFNKNFIKENIIDKEIGKIVRESFEKRMKSDYDAMYDFSKEEVEELLNKSIKAMKEISYLL